MYIETAYMRYGKGPSTLIDSTLALWVLSLSLFGQLKNDLEAMQEGEDQKVVTCHRKERVHVRLNRIKSDVADRKRIREALSTCLDAFNSEKHPPSSLVNIYTGKVVDDSAVNADDPIKIGSDQMNENERKLLKGFHGTIKKKVKGMAKASDICRQEVRYLQLPIQG